MTLEAHLAHLTAMLAPPWTNAWWPQVKHRAAEIAAQDVSCADLPQLMAAERERIRAAATKSAKAACTTTEGCP